MSPEVSGKVTCGFLPGSTLATTGSPRERRVVFFRKLCNVRTPVTAGVSAAGIMGSLALAQCCSPLTRYLCIVVWKVSWTCPAVPENSNTVRPLVVPTWNP